MATLEVEINGEAHLVRIDPDADQAGRWHVTWGQVTHIVDAQALDARTLSLVEVGDGTRSHEARVVQAARPGELEVHVAGAVVQAVVGAPRRYRGSDPAQAGAGAQEVVAPMPGKVVRLLVGPGDHVAEQQGVVVVEAMKMENELTARRAGQVAGVHVAEGESVEAGKVLVVIE